MNILEETKYIMNKYNVHPNKKLGQNFLFDEESLEKIAEELENENIDLDASVKKFEEGMALSQKCNKMLEDAEKKITILIDGEEKNFVPMQEE